MERLKKFGLREDKLFKELTTFKIGGPIRRLVYPKNYEEIRECIEIAQENNLNYFILGNGSNILCLDGGYDGIVISMLSLNDIALNGDIIEAGAGISIYDLAVFAEMNSLSGLEFAEGIPGTIGGAIYMNAGAYDSQIEDIIISCEVLEANGELRTYQREEMQMGKRKSIFQETHGVIISGKFLLTKSNKNEIRERMDGYQKRRMEKQPLEYGSGGSIFKRPEGHFAGKLIEDAGLKGLRFRDAEISSKHAGFIVNRKNATAKEVITLIETTQKIIKDKTGIILEREVVVIGEEA